MYQVLKEYISTSIRIRLQVVIYLPTCVVKRNARNAMVQANKGVVKSLVEVTFMSDQLLLMNAFALVILKVILLLVISIKVCY